MQISDRDLNAHAQQKAEEKKQRKRLKIASV